MGATPTGIDPFVSLNAVTGTVTGTPVEVAGFDDGFAPLCFITLTGTATVLLEAADRNLAGSYLNVSNPAAGYTANTIVVLDPRVPFYRPRVSAYTSGTITVSFGPGRARGLLANVRGAVVVSSGVE